MHSKKLVHRSVHLKISFVHLRVHPVKTNDLDNCKYATPDVNAASLFNLHNNVHINANGSSSKPNPPKMDRPCIGRDCNEEVWNTFLKKMENL